MAISQNKLGSANSDNQLLEIAALDLIKSNTALLPPGAATLSAQATGNTSLNSIDQKIPSLGQKPIAQSLSIALASDQGPLAIQASALPLPNGAATEVSLVALENKIPQLGSKTMAGSLPVTLATDQPALPVTAGSLPLPNGAATSVLQSAGNASLATIASAVGSTPIGSATSSKQDVGNTVLSDIDSKIPSLMSLAPSSDTGQPGIAVRVISQLGAGSGGSTGGLTDVQLRASPIPVSGVFFQGTQPISAVALPLPDGAATLASQNAGNASLSSLDSKIPSLMATAPSSDTGQPGIAVRVISQLGAGSGGSTGGLTDVQLRASAVPVAGSFFQATQPISAASLPLPIGAALDASVTAMSAKLPTTLGQKLMAASLPVTLASDQPSLPVTGTFFPASQAITAIALPLPSGAATSALQSAGNASLVTIAASAGALPPGAATSALQGTGNTSLASIDSKTPSVGQKAMASSAPVTIASDQPALPVTLASIPLAAGQALDSTVSSIASKLPATLGQKVMAASLGVTLASDQPALPVTGIFFQASQPVTAIALPLPAGAATSALQSTGNASLTSIDTKTPSVGQKAMVASAPVTIASDQTAIPVTVGAMALPTGASTDATLSAMSGKLPATLGQKLMAASLPVTLSSDQTALPVTGTFFQGTQPVSAVALPLPAGAATSALQTTGNTSLASLDGKTPTVGQKTMAGSAPVTIASDQASIPVTIGSMALPTGASTDATLSAMSGKLPATLGQKLMAASLPVTLASDQPALPVSGVFFQGTQPISAVALPLPSGAATAANQATVIASLATIVTNTGLQSAGNASLATIVTNTGLQSAGNTSLSSIDTKTPTVGQKAMAASSPITIASDQSALPVNGTVASGTADSGNPNKIGGVAQNTIPANVATGARVNGNYDLAGRQVVSFSDRALYVRGNPITLTTTTETSILAAAGAGIFNDMAGMVMSNGSATAVRVDIRSVLAGGIDFSVWLAPNGGCVLNPAIPINQDTAASAWSAQLSVAVTDVRLTMMAIQRK